MNDRENQKEQCCTIAFKVYSRTKNKYKTLEDFKAKITAKEINDLSFVNYCINKTENSGNVNSISFATIYKATTEWRKVYYFDEKNGVQEIDQTKPFYNFKYTHIFNEKIKNKIEKKYKKISIIELMLDEEIINDSENFMFLFYN